MQIMYLNAAAISTQTNKYALVLGEIRLRKSPYTKLYLLDTQVSGVHDSKSYFNYTRDLKIPKSLEWRREWVLVVEEFKGQSPF